MKRPISRRELLLGATALLVGCKVNEPQEGVLGAMDRFTNRAEGTLFHGHDAAEPAITPAASFPKYKVGAAFPEVPAGWALEVGGMVKTPLRLTLDDLMKLPRAEMRVRHYCVEGWTAVASWHGVRVSELARLAGADPSARFVDFVSFEASGDDDDDDSDEEEDGKAAPGAKKIAKTYSSCWDLGSALHGQTLMAYGMNGAPLGKDHGGPVRLYGSSKLGYKQVKWMREIRFLPQQTGGYWEDQGYEWFAGV